MTMAWRPGRVLAGAALCAAILAGVSFHVDGAARSAEPSAPPSGTASALIDALRRAPDDPATRAAPIGYVDFRAAEAARPGALRPGSYAELQAALDRDDAAAHLWVAAMMGVASGTGTSDVQLGMLRSGLEWPDLLGFDAMDLDRQLMIGEPPDTGLALLGDVDPVAVTAAFEALGRDATALGARTLLCGDAGCAAGHDVDLGAIDPRDPFGGTLGQQRPVAVSTADILSSADEGVVRAMAGAADGSVASLADDPMVRALAGALPEGTTLIQATLLPGGVAGVGPGIYGEMTGSPEAASALLERLDAAFEPMPAWGAAAFLDGATATEQVVSVALAYQDEADAAVAADVLPGRVADLPSLVGEGTIGDLLAARGVTSVTARVVPPGDGTSALAVLDLRAPLAGSADSAAGSARPAPSSEVYGLLVRMLVTRDVVWLLPVLPLE